MDVRDFIASNAAEVFAAMRAEGAGRSRCSDQGVARARQSASACCGSARTSSVGGLRAPPRARRADSARAQAAGSRRRPADRPARSSTSSPVACAFSRARASASSERIRGDRSVRRGAPASRASASVRASRRRCRRRAATALLGKELQAPFDENLRLGPRHECTRFRPPPRFSRRRAQPPSRYARGSRAPRRWTSSRSPRSASASGRRCWGYSSMRCRPSARASSSSASSRGLSTPRPAR